MRSLLIWSAIASAGLTALSTYAQNLPAAHPESPPPLVPIEVLHALGSGVFAERDAAQNRLDNVPLAQRDALAQLATTIADPEAHNRLLARVDAMDDDLAINPPLISLDVKDANPQQLAEALGKSLNIPMRAVVMTNHDTDRFTLSVKDAPFWDIFYQLHGQHPITFNRDTSKNWILYDDGGKADTPLESAKGFLVEVSRATPRALAAVALPMIAQPGPGQVALIAVMPRYAGGMAVTFRLTADPRLDVESMKFSVRPELKDDAGHSLTVVSTDPAAVKTGDFSWAATASIGTPAQVGKTIKSLKVTAVMTAAVDPQRVVVDHPEEMLDKPIHVGSAIFTIRRAERGVAQTKYTIDLPQHAVNVSVCVIDAAGARASSVFFPNANAGTIPISTGALSPFKLEFMAARAMKEVTLPMEWHDIPIEGMPSVNPIGDGAFMDPGAAWINGDVIRFNDAAQQQQGPGIQSLPAELNGLRSR